MRTIRTTLVILGAVALAACATKPPEPLGRHMVVRDLSGKLVMQFDYPTEDLCAKTSGAMRGTVYKAGCAQASVADPLRGQATLRYSPPGVLVQGHYQDLAACRTLTAQLSPGVELVQACAAK